MTETNPPIVQCTGNAHDQIGETFLGVAQDIFHNPTAFDTGNHMFDSDAHAGHQAVEEQIGNTQIFASRFLLGLAGEHAEWRIALKASVLDERGVWRILNGFAVSDFRVVGFATIGLAQIIYALDMFVNQNYVFVVWVFFSHYTLHAVWQGFSGVGDAVPFRQ